MSISANDANDRYIGDGTTNSFAYNFKVLDQSQILVLVDGIPMTLGSHYSVSGVGNASGGISFFIAPLTGAVISILRSQPIEQITAYIANEAYNPLKLAGDLDKSVMVDQMQEEEISRAVKFTKQSTYANRVLPEPVTGSYLTWNSSGDIINNPGTPAANANPFYPFAAAGDGITDITSIIQSAIDGAGLAGRTLYIPAGTYIVDGLTLSTNLTLIGDGKTTILKRKSHSIKNTFISATGKSNFTIRNIAIDGNLINQTVPAPNLLFTICQDWEVSDCLITGAYGSMGLQVNGGTNGVNNKESMILRNDIDSNGDSGVYISNEWNIQIIGNYVKSHTGGTGIFLGNPLIVPVSDQQTKIIVENNHVALNKYGILVNGFYTGYGAGGKPIYGHGIPESVGIIISGNIAKQNLTYGIVCHGFGQVVTNNYVVKNGTTQNDAGILANAASSVFNNNVIQDNAGYGIDGGACANCTFNGNSFVYGSSTAGLYFTGLNIGAGATCIGNTFAHNGGAGGVHIIMPGFDSDGTSTGGINLPIQFTNISNNNITAVDSSLLGIYLFAGADYVNCNNNSVQSAGVLENAFIFEGGSDATMRLIQGGNVHWEFGQEPQIASGATLVIPDFGEIFFVTGTTGITSIQTRSSFLFFQKVRFVQITNQGSNYTSAPTPNFSAGAGTGAAGTCVIDGSGKLIGVLMTNPGANYTADFAVTFSGGGGSGAAATARTGCNNFYGREITLSFQGSLTVTDGSNLKLAGNLSAGAGTILRLHGAFTFWYEISRSIN